jgi:hypothetical protein
MASVGDFNSAPTEGRFEPTPRLRRCRYSYMSWRVAQCPMRRAVDLHLRYKSENDKIVQQSGLARDDATLLGDGVAVLVFDPSHAR